MISWSAVAVERNFSGGRDKILFRRADLKPETIRILTLVKKRVCLPRDVAEKVLRDSEYCYLLFPPYKTDFRVFDYRNAVYGRLRVPPVPSVLSMLTGTV
jgi:hypothetical protein